MVDYALSKKGIKNNDHFFFLAFFALSIPLRMNVSFFKVS
jgi:hypothetical protein